MDRDERWRQFFRLLDEIISDYGEMNMDAAADMTDIALEDAQWKADLGVLWLWSHPEEQP